MVWQGPGNPLGLQGLLRAVEHELNDKWNGQGITGPPRP